MSLVNVWPICPVPDGMVMHAPVSQECGYRTISDKRQSVLIIRLNRIIFLLREKGHSGRGVDAQHMVLAEMSVDVTV